jgi:hypothetical protein
MVDLSIIPGDDEFENEQSEIEQNFVLTIQREINDADSNVVC